MNPFAFSCIMPHGGELVPELAGEDPQRMKVTRGAMERLGRMMEEGQPDTILVITPHGTGVDGRFAITDSERLVGVVEENGARYEMARTVDRVAAAEIVVEAKKANLPAASIHFGTSEGEGSVLPLDWGAIVPLRFMPDVPVVVVTPSKKTAPDELMRFGAVLRKTAEQATTKFGLIASCDWSHTHDESGPYGFSPQAKRVDEEVVRLVKANRLEAMRELDGDAVEEAKPDGLRQALVLAGAIPKGERRVDFLSYEVPTYFGMICAGFR
ncbi:MAG TPA: extradiol ring-cleavage dioxygenase [Bacillales bacterium]|nr:extradiol ring-cleavage dioxygenase [Bacillales bacterium]